MKKVILFVLFALCSTMMLAQTITVKGTVIGAEDGMPVIGAYVLQQGTNNGTSTD
ncbi:MAG: TonB-dependent receptor, partial [Bacteroidales bacterium]|nr:TonB-dependent receptor [Bacteroidales bacterium]